MKKNSFIEGTIIATLAIVIVKILGMLYVIPFCAIVGEAGRALYGYAYNIYGLFLEISTAGIPNAVGKLVNEYNTLEKQEAKVRTFKIGKRILSVIAIITFLILFLFAKPIAMLILGKLELVNTVDDVAFVIRCVSFALLVFPFLSVSRGFFQGHRIISVSSVSQVIEQFFRVAVIIGGSYIAVNVLGLDTRETIGIAVFGAFIGGACALIYMLGKLNKNKKELSLDKKFEVQDDVTNKEIIKKIIKYAVPSVIISVAFMIYNNVDMIILLRVMDYLGFSASEVEFISTGIGTWAAKIFIIITSVGLGMATSLVPNMVESFTLKKYDDVNNKFNKAIEIVIFISLPMCVGISLLSAAIWSVFYGYNSIGTNILAIGIFSPLFTNLFSIANYTLQSMNKFKLVYISSILGIFLNMVLDAPFMLLLDVLHLPAYFGATIATAVGLSSTIFLAMYFLRREYNFRYGEILRVVKKSLVPLLTMIIVVLLMKMFINVNLESRFYAIIYIGVISIVGAISYFIVAFKMGLIKEVLGNDFIEKLKCKFLKNKKEA